MQANRSRDTKPELALRQALHAMGLRYRVCARPVPDIPRAVDVVFRPARVAVEVRGCFWHGCPEHYRRPKANEGYWSAKVARNLARDVDTERRLEAAGWLLIVVWEHEDPREVAAKVAALVLQRRPDSARGRTADHALPPAPFEDFSELGEPLRRGGEPVLRCHGVPRVESELTGEPGTAIGFPGHASGG